MVAAWAGFAATGEPGWQPLGDASRDAIMIWGATAAAAGPGFWRDGEALRELWSTFAYRPAQA